MWGSDQRAKSYISKAKNKKKFGDKGAFTQKGNQPWSFVRVLRC